MVSDQCLHPHSRKCAQLYPTLYSLVRQSNSHNKGHPLEVKWAINFEVASFVMCLTRA